MSDHATPTPSPTTRSVHADSGRRRVLRGLPSLLLAGALGTAMLLGGCAGTPQISADVASFGTWPAGRSAGSYSIERLPSQARGGAEQEQLEAAARAALERAGFRPAGATDQADVLVQVGGRQGKVLEASPWFDFGLAGWWGAGPRHARWPGPHRRFSAGVGVGFGPSWGPWPVDPVRDYREVALMLIDRSSRSPLVEVHVRQEARYVSDASVGAMFDAALLGFPQLPEGERTVVMPITPPKG
ncbi:MAG: hypothetical protein RLZZ584_618 [Pseudomonadota bacterium]